LSRRHPPQCQFPWRSCQWRRCQPHPQPPATSSTGGAAPGSTEARLGARGAACVDTARASPTAIARINVRISISPKENLRGIVDSWRLRNPETPGRSSWMPRQAKGSCDQSAFLSPPSGWPEGGTWRARRVCAACATLSASLTWLVSGWLLGWDNTGSRGASATGPPRGGGQASGGWDTSCCASEVATGVTALPSAPSLK